MLEKLNEISMVRYIANSPSLLSFTVLKYFMIKKNVIIIFYDYTFNHKIIYVLALLFVRENVILLFIDIK